MHRKGARKSRSWTTNTSNNTSGRDTNSTNTNAPHTHFVPPFLSTHPSYGAINNSDDVIPTNFNTIVSYEGPSTSFSSIHQESEGNGNTAPPSTSASNIELCT